MMILFLTLTPVYQLLDRPETGSFGVGTIIRGSTHLQTAWWGTVLAVSVGAILTLTFGTGPVRHWLARVGLALGRIPTGRWACACGAVAATLAATAQSVVFRGLPTLVDEMSTLLSARAMASGQLGIDLPEPSAAWVIPNTLMTAEGWVSQYPPMSPLLLAIGYLVGSPSLMGPLLLGVTVTMSVLVADHLLPEEPSVVRLGGVLLAMSPFLVFIGSGYLSHVPAAAFAALALYVTLRARDGHLGWSFLTGVAAGGLVTTRPWTGLALGVVYPAALWAERAVRGRGARWWATRALGATLGGAPFAISLAWYDRTLFGSMLTMGYDLAYGPAHGLGFHPDPWGNVYGPVEALGYSAANLLTLGVYLLETAVPALALVGLFLLATRRVPAGAWVLLSWGLLPVLANALYWHHGFHLGPRMLYEAAPAWILLTALAAVRMTTPRIDAGEALHHRGSRRERLQPCDVLLWTLLVSLAAPLVFANRRAESYSWSEEALARIVVPEVPDDAVALVFVHGSWAERIAGRLQGNGMRLDSIETALRRNDACLLHTYTSERLSRGRSASADAPLPSLDFELLPGAPPHLRPLALVDGSRMGVDPTFEVTTECVREARADRFGVISLAPLVWQGDLPRIESGQPMFVRDLGPAENDAILEEFPERTPWLYRTEEPGGAPVLVPYATGIAELWGEETGDGQLTGGQQLPSY